MEANDLMIGDYVLSDNKIHKVTRLSLQRAAMQNVCDGAVTVARYDRLYPVPLTSEILRQNCFEVVTDLSCMLMYFSRVSDNTVVQIEDNRIAACPLWHVHVVIKDRAMVCDIRKDIDYIHELQHMLKLAKIPYEILL